ncbi:hypothetical protein BJ742DRAFT_770826 [Cladochytrium replicatum]|nr:hypothetical protein BJ742DRAFT_770826 [Cladochytrium replicatum]
MKPFKLFNTKDETAKTAKKESAIISVQSLSPLTNGTVLVQLELPLDITFSDFAAASMDIRRTFLSTPLSRVFVEWRVREIANSSLPLARTCTSYDD